MSLGGVVLRSAHHQGWRKQRVRRLRCGATELRPFLPEEDSKTTPTLRQKAPRRGLAKESAARWKQGAWCCGLKLRKGIITLQGFDEKTLGSHLCLKFGGN